LWKKAAAKPFFAVIDMKLPKFAKKNPAKMKIFS